MCLDSAGYTQFLFAISDSDPKSVSDWRILGRHFHFVLLSDDLTLGPERGWVDAVNALVALIYAIGLAMMTFKLGD